MEHSYVTGDKTFCVYLAKSVDAINEHARPSGFPATVITEVSSIMRDDDPGGKVGDVAGRPPLAIGVASRRRSRV